MSRVQERMINIVQDWSQELSERLQRPAKELLSGGLSASDFSSGKSVEIIFSDGSSINFKYAFSVISEERGAVAVFTEHCGYYVFPLLSEMIITQRTDEVYFVD